MAGLSDFMDRFEKLTMSQKDIISDAEREIGVWKNAYSSRDNEIAALRKELAELRQVKSEPGGANPLLLCLIDGDGCIFKEDFLLAGVDGGRKAASTLRQHIVGHYGGNADILVHIFFNREGLGGTLKRCFGVASSTFNAFISGFNTASPLMSMLDVGAGKEAADAKIRELMRIFVRYPNVKKIYFGGGHDNGYGANLTTLHNEGYLDKIVILQGYTQLAAEIKALGLPCLENKGLFLTEKISNKTSTNTTPAPGMNRARSATKSPASPLLPPPPPPPPSNIIRVQSGKNHKANVAILKSLKPRACNHHYLTQRGCNMPECPYSHDYEFDPDLLNDFRALVKQNPCILANKGMDCRDIECPSAHQCPQGPNCTWHKQGNCKFVAPGMHGTPVTSEDDDDRVLVAQRIASLHARSGSNASSTIDFPDYPTGMSPSPGKKTGSISARMTPIGRAQVKDAFKNSINGLTPKERLQQMGVGAASNPFIDDDFSDGVEQQQYARTQNPEYVTQIRPSANRLVPLSHDWNGSPSKYGIGLNGRQMGAGIY